MADNSFLGSDFSFDLPKNKSASIKVLGIGGGGTNAVNYMFEQGIHGVDFVVCNTDAQALANSPVPNKVQLGVNLTEGLGAGANPEIGQKAAEETKDEIREMLSYNTKMVFITAGMGGGTGTGAAPIIASIAKEIGILSVGIVTIPFYFEGSKRKQQAKEGIEEFRKHVDSLIIINNDKLRELYGNLGFKQGFSKADEILATAAKGIAEVITHHFTQNIDLHDVKTVLSESGTAIMGTGMASGSGRADEAVRKALDSPLLNNNTINGAKNVLLLIVSGQKEITIDEIGQINDHIQTEAGHRANIIMGIGEDDEMVEDISVTIVATGFPENQQNSLISREEKKNYYTLEEDQPVQKMISLDDDASFKSPTDQSLDNHFSGRGFGYESEKKYEEPQDISPNQTSLEFNGSIYSQNTEESDQPLSNQGEEKITRFSLFDETEDLEQNNVEAPESTINSTELNQNLEEEDELIQFKIKKFSEKEDQPKATKPNQNFQLNDNPFDQPIEDLKKEVQNKTNVSLFDNVDEIEKEPAFKRRGVDLDNLSPKISRFSLEIDDKNEFRIKEQNSFLNKNID